MHTYIRLTWRVSPVIRCSNNSLSPHVSLVHKILHLCTVTDIALIIIISLEFVWVIGWPALVIGWPAVVIGRPALVIGRPVVVIGRPAVVIGRPALVGGIRYTRTMAWK